MVCLTLNTDAPKYFGNMLQKQSVVLCNVWIWWLFWGPADRDFAIDRYGLDPARCYHYCFGVDERFWSPNEHPTEEGRQFVSVGSDPNRDYKTLLAAPTDIDIVILTRLPIEVPTGRSITVLKGSFWEGDVSDQQVRELYRKSMGVVVPLNDVYQPTGQSVTIQAMACGKPVVLTRNKGLWAPSLLRHQENCILVPPSDPIALADALKRLEEDPQLRKALGENARKTVLAHWGLQATVHSTRQIVDQGLATTFRKQ
jgi:glycosyltransferase involved in cell wall biosynthesis